MDPVKKYKIIYSVELIVIAIVAIVLGVFFWIEKLGRSDHFPIVYVVLTMTGSTWILVDFIWAMASKKRQARISLIDKIITLPLGLGLLTFDIYSLVNGLNKDTFLSKYVAVFFLYIAIIYIFEGIYHYFKPVPGLIDIEEIDQKIEESIKEPEVVEEIKEEKKDE